MKPVATVAVSALIGAVAAIVVGLVGLDRIGVMGGVKRTVHAQIFLEPVSGECIINTFPYTLEAFKKDRVQWTIFDRCAITNSNDVVIEFQDNPGANCNLHGRRHITCSLKDDVQYKSYKYSVSAEGAQTEDPELEIVF